MTPPQTPREWALHRATLNCRVGANALAGTGDTPPGITPHDYALYCLLKAVEQLAEAMNEETKT